MREGEKKSEKPIVQTFSREKIRHNVRRGPVVNSERREKSVKDISYRGNQISLRANGRRFFRGTFISSHQ